MFGWFRRQMIGSCVFACLVTSFFIGDAIAGGKGAVPWPVAGLSCVFSLLVIRQFLFKTALELKIEGHDFTWRTAFACNTVALSDLRQVRRSVGVTNVVVIELKDGRRLLVRVGQGFENFMRDLQATSPGLPIAFSQWFAKRAEGLPQNPSEYEHYESAPGGAASGSARPPGAGGDERGKRTSTS